MREVAGRALNPIGHPRARRFNRVLPIRLTWSAEIEYGYHFLKQIQIRSLVQTEADRLIVKESRVYSRCLELRMYFPWLSQLRRRSQTNRIECRIAVLANRFAVERLKDVAKRLGERVNPLRDPAQPGRAVIDGVHAGHDGQ